MKDDIKKMSDHELVKEVCRRFAEGRITDAQLLHELLKTLRRLGIIKSEPGED